MRRVAPLVALTLALVAGACSDSDPASRAISSTSTTTVPPVPGDVWEVAAPEASGFDPAKLDAVLAEAEAAGSQCVAVVRDGRLVTDAAWPNPEEPREVFSITKSLTSVLIGIAEYQGLLALDDPVAKYVPEWAATPSEAVTIEHILTGVSGRHWDFATDYGEMAVRAQDKTAFSIALDQQHAPGEVWAYNNAAVQVLSRVIEAATGVDASTFAARALFEPLGMSHSELQRDASGGSLTFMGWRSTCGDVARLGLLMLHGGRWGDEQLLAPEYVAAATAPATPLNAAYGRLWWVNGAGPIAGPRLATTGRPGEGQFEGPLVRDAPADAFWALGFNDQVLAVLPTEGVVAVRLGRKPPAERPFGVQQFTTGIIEAMVER